METYLLLNVSENEWRCTLTSAFQQVCHVTHDTSDIQQCAAVAHSSYRQAVGVV